MRLFDHAQAYGTREQSRERRLGGLFVLICEGDNFPRGYGVAWRDWGSLRVWCCPVPLNKVIGWLRIAYLNLTAPPESEREKARVEAAVERIFALREQDQAERLRRALSRGQENAWIMRRNVERVDVYVGAFGRFQLTWHLDHELRSGRGAAAEPSPPPRSEVSERPVPRPSTIPEPPP